MNYSASMQSLSMLDFRKHTEAILAKLSKGERFVLTYRGKPVAHLLPIGHNELADDPIYDLFELASEKAKPLSNREMDRTAYRA